VARAHSFPLPRCVAVKHLLLLRCPLVRRFRLYLSMLCLQFLFVGIQLGLPAYEDMVFARRIDIVRFPLILHRGDSVRGQLGYELLLRRIGEAFGFKTGLG